MTNEPESTLDIDALRKGLPEGPWYACECSDETCGAVFREGEETIYDVGEKPLAIRIAAIPDMLTEIQRLRDENSNLDASCRIEYRENERLRALNAEMREALVETLRMLEAAYRQLGMWTKDNKRIAKACAILAKTETDQ